MSDKQPPVFKRSMLTKTLAASRFLLLIPVIGCLLIALGVLAFDTALIIKTVIATTQDTEVSVTSGKNLALTAIEAIDLFLIATVAYITAAGLYTLFISPDVPWPLRLGIESLDDLKEKVIGVVVVALGVLFLGDAINWDGEQGLLYFGGAVAAVIAALGYFVRHNEKHGDTG